MPINKRIRDLENKSFAKVKEPTSLIIITFPDGHLEVNNKPITEEEISNFHDLQLIIYLPDNGRD